MKAERAYLENFVRGTQDLLKWNHIILAKHRCLHERSTGDVYIICVRKTYISFNIGKSTRILKFYVFFSSLFTTAIGIEKDRELRAQWSPRVHRGYSPKGLWNTVKRKYLAAFGRGIPWKPVSTLSFFSFSCCYRPCQKYGIKDRGVNQSDGTSVRVPQWGEAAGSGVERAVRKICQDLRARNSPHGCPECKEFFVPLSLALAAAAAAAAASSVKTVRRRGYVPTCAVPIFRRRVTVNYSLTVNPTSRYRKLRIEDRHVPRSSVSLQRTCLFPYSAR